MTFIAWFALKKVHLKAFLEVCPLWHHRGHLYFNETFLRIVSAKSLPNFNIWKFWILYWSAYLCYISIFFFIKYDTLFSLNIFFILNAFIVIYLYCTSSGRAWKSPSASCSRSGWADPTVLAVRRPPPLPCTPATWTRAQDQVWRDGNSLFFFPFPFVVVAKTMCNVILMFQMVNVSTPPLRWGTIQTQHVGGRGGGLTLLVFVSRMPERQRRM